MRTIMIVLLAGTAISASAMSMVSANDKKAENTVDVKSAKLVEKAETVSKTADATITVTEASYAAGDKGKQAHSLDAKIEEMFVVADLNADGQLTEVEYIEYQMAKAKKQFVSMSGDDGQASLEEVKGWYTAKNATSAAARSDGASE